MSEMRQFNLRILMAAVLLAAIGLALLRQAEGVTQFEFGVFVIFAFAAFGAGFSAIAGKLLLWTGIGAAVGVAITLWAIFD
jgi:hypothetical protein